MGGGAEEVVVEGAFGGCVEGATSWTSSSISSPEKPKLKDMTGQMFHAREQWQSLGREMVLFFGCGGAIDKGEARHWSVLRRETRPRVPKMLREVTELCGRLRTAPTPPTLKLIYCCD